ncbi:hypothetical protein QVD17_29638 [Tagetes erecta]|uniref:Transcription repressor n=1 Tax=Tagetes erecta TaxID=13708 RepID=A0AAD8K2N3_TARER|nr:hypothetical protein QVD17_29638 [Tagetes erecta]
MDTGFKFRISKLFQSSFKSCRSKHTSDVSSDHPFFFPENRHHRHLINLFSPKPQPHSSSSHHKPKPHSLRPKISDQNTLSPENQKAGNPLFHKKPKSTKKKKTHHRKQIKTQSFSSITDNLYYNYCTSDEDNEIDDQTTLFSSFSSDSSVSFYKNRAPRKKGKKSGNVSRCRDRKATDVIPINRNGKLVKDSVAIVKKSSDPHEDFRVSMLEMIVERQIFGGEDLENLLKCFLSLNCEEHHRVICDVFTEIWETLFTDS